MPNCMKCSAIYALTKRKSRLCLSCKRTYDKAWRSRRKAEGRPVISTKMPPEYHRNYEKKYYARPEVKRRRADQMRTYTLDPILRPRHKARWLAQRAIKYGRLIKQPCEVCASQITQAHHDDYSKPLDVRWLCRKHHVEYHNNAKAEGRE